jgi:hypothetical protein
MQNLRGDFSHARRMEGIGKNADRHWMTSKSWRKFRDLAMAQADDSLRSLLARLSRIDVMVIDDWAMAPLSEPERPRTWNNRQLSLSDPTLEGGSMIKHPGGMQIMRIRNQITSGKLRGVWVCFPEDTRRAETLRVISDSAAYLSTTSAPHE